MSYWDTMAAAAVQLEQRHFAVAERLFLEALADRKRSPGRVFLTEKVSDGLRRLWGGVSGKAAALQPAGRWQATITAFRLTFQSQGEESVRDALRLSDFLPEEGTEANQALLVSALFLLTRSELFSEELATAVPVLKAAFRTALRTGQLFEVDLVRHDLPLTEEDRLWLARQGDHLLESVFAGDASGQVSVRRKEWARVLCQLLQPVYFESEGRLEEKRRWYEVLLIDRHLAEPDKAVVQYRAFVNTFPHSAARVAAARVRLLELPGNIGGQFFKVPRYREVEQELARGEPPGEVEAARRYAAVARIIAWRRPTVEPGQAWATVATAEDGTLAFVYWRGEEPRDVAIHSPGDDPESLVDFLAPCQQRLVWSEAEVDLALATLPPQLRVGWPVRYFAEALLESQLPGSGLSDAVAERFAMSQSSAWRGSWDWRRGHAWLTPPSRPGGLREQVPDAVRTATTTGLLWLAVLQRLRKADPCLLLGCEEMSRREDAAAGFLVSFCDAQRDDLNLQRRGWSPWQVPPLSLRPDPLTSLARSPAEAGPDPGPRPDLTGNQVAIVTTGQPAATMAAWGATAHHWRCVIDRPERFGALATAVGNLGGLVTLLPAGGVHHWPDAVKLLEDLLAETTRSEGGREALLPLFHWIRLVETHNGDLLDFQFARHRHPGVIPLCDLYLSRVNDLTRRQLIDTPTSSPDAGANWAEEYRDRSRRSRVVVGMSDQLLGALPELDALWGVTSGGDAAWIFLDSPSIHWQVWRRGGLDPHDLHGRLASRGRRHLSVVLGGQFLADELAAMLGHWLQAYGSPYNLLLTDARPPFLHLAAAGVAPDARVLILAAAFGQLEHVRGQAAQGERVAVLLPEAGQLAPLWWDIARERRAAGGFAASTRWISEADFWDVHGSAGELSRRRLVVPSLASLENRPTEPPSGFTQSVWQSADRSREDALARQRQLCALEVNAYLASGAASVDIADPRWWHRFTLTDDEGQRRLAPDGAHAVAWATGNSGRSYDLPGGSLPADATQHGRSHQAGSPSLLGVIKDWLQEHGLLDTHELGHPPGFKAWPPVMSTPTDLAPVRLRLDGLQAAWYPVARDLAMRRERGDQAAWLLLVGDRPPPEASALLAAYPAPGPSVPGRGHAAGDPGNRQVSATWGGPPLVWASLRELGDEGVRDDLEAAEPLAIVAGDLCSWLPREHAPRLTAARTLRWLVGCRVNQVDIWTHRLPAAWESLLHSFWADTLAGRGSVVPHAVGDRDDSLTTANGTPVALGRLAALDRHCVACGTRFADKTGWSACPACGLDSASWPNGGGEQGQPEPLLQLKLRTLAERSDLGVDSILNVWLRAADLAQGPAALNELGIRYRRDGSDLHALPDGGRNWRITAADPGDHDLAGSDHAILYPPVAEIAACGGLVARSRSVTFWFHPCELERMPWLPPLHLVHRIQGLLRYLIPRDKGSGSLGASGAPEPTGEILPAALLETFTGLDQVELMSCLHALRWVAVLSGDLVPVSSPDAGRTGSPSQVLVARLSFAEIDYRAQRMIDALNLLLPLILATTHSGQLTLYDLNALPARIPAEDLQWLDAYLLSASLRLAFPGDEQEAGYQRAPLDSSEEELLYRPVAGTLFSSRRQVGYLGSVQGVTARLRHHVELTLASLKLVMSEAVTGEEGYVIPLDPVRMPLLDPTLIELGCALGIWKWLGPAAAAAVPVADLRVMARTEPLTPEGMATRLVRDLATTRMVWEGHMRRCLPLGLLEPAADPVGDTTDGAVRERIGKSTSGRLPAPIGDAAERICRLLLGGGRGSLVLSGPVGSGRLLAVGHGLARAVGRGLAPHSLSVVCPDQATAVRMQSLWRREVGPWQPPIFIVGDPGLSGMAGNEPVGGAIGMATLILEVHRIPTEERYRLCQQASQGPLISCVESYESSEQWDHLFLSTPPPDDVLHFTRQRRQARKIWEQVSQLLPSDGKPGRSERRLKGECRARSAANLDECLAALENLVATGKLAERFSVVAPLLEDLTYLGRRMAATGWIPVFRHELEHLLLPGPLEFLAALADLEPSLARTEELESAPGAAAETVAWDPERPTDQAGSLLAPLLTEQGRRRYADWRASTDECQKGAGSVMDFYESIRRTGWAAEFLVFPPARQRVEKLVQDLADEKPAQLAARPLWTAWRREVAILTAQERSELGGPVIDLATPDAPVGSLTRSLVYLCLGSESRRSHYRVMSRVTDHLLVLFQEHSPLPGDGDLPL